MPFFETERVGGSFTVHGGLLAQAGVDVHGGEEGDRHGEVMKTERVREHGPGEEVGVLEGQRESVAILTLDEIPNLFENNNKVYNFIIYTSEIIF